MAGGGVGAETCPPCEEGATRLPAGAASSAWRFDSCSLLMVHPEGDGLEGVGHMTRREDWVSFNAAFLLCTSQRRPGSSFAGHCFPRLPTAVQQAVCGADRCTFMRPKRHMPRPLRLIDSAP
jgi:hypothetical protein